MAENTKGRSWGRIVVAVLYAVLAAAAANEAFLIFTGSDDSPRAIGSLQAVVAAAGFAAAWGSWSGARWAFIAALAYGVTVCTLLLSLGPILDLGADERGGIMVGAAIMAAVSLAAAWYLRRATRPSSIASPVQDQQRG